MKLNHIVAAAMCAVALTPLAEMQAQTASPRIVDSVNMQMLRTAKPAKTSTGAAAAKTGSTSMKASGASLAKPVRVVQVPAIISHSAAPAPATVSATAHAVAHTDSSVKAMPAVQRAPKSAKTKPPAK